MFQNRKEQTRPDSLLWVALQVFALSSFAVAQPLYDLLGGTPDFFVANRVNAKILLVAASFVAIAIPAAIVGVLAMSRLLGPQVGHCCFLIVVATMIGLVVLPPLNRCGALNGWFAIFAAAMTGSSAAVMFHVFPRVRSFVSVLSPAGILFFLVFLFWTDASKIVFPKEIEIQGAANQGADIPVVFVIFDMFSLPAMLDSAGRFDREMFPNFSELADQSYWFKNASTVATSTNLSVPAILTGLNPRANALPIASDYPNNLFTMMGGWADLHVFETTTELCPSDLCPRATPPDTVILRQLVDDVWIIYQHLVVPADLRAGLANISSDWGGFGTRFEEAEASGQAEKYQFRELLEKQARSETRHRLKDSFHHDRTRKFETFLRSLETTTNNGLFYLHLNLPHSPITLLPSGKTYVPNAKTYSYMRVLEGAGTGKHIDGWTNNQQVVGLAYQRYLLQASHVDALLGRLIRKMEQTGLFDRALLVVVSDHGKSFVPGKRQRAPSDCASHCVPLIVKLPGQKEGVVSGRNAETIDILPTITEVLALSTPWNFEGHSLLSPEPELRAEKNIQGISGAIKLEWPGDYLERSVAQLSDLKASTMSADARATLGPSPEIVGQTVQDVLATGKAVEIFDAKSFRGGLVYEIDQTSFLQNAKPKSHFVPAYITGRILLPRGDSKRLAIAFAVNGVVEATTYTFKKGQRSGQLALLVPESVIVSGRNNTRLLLLQDR